MRKVEKLKTPESIREKVSSERKADQSGTDADADNTGTDADADKTSSDDGADTSKKEDISTYPSLSYREAWFV